MYDVHFLIAVKFSFKTTLNNKAIMYIARYHMIRRFPGKYPRRHFQNFCYYIFFIHNERRPHKYYLIALRKVYIYNIRLILHYPNNSKFHSIYGTRDYQLLFYISFHNLWESNDKIANAINVA